MSIFLGLIMQCYQLDYCLIRNGFRKYNERQYIKSCLKDNDTKKGKNDCLVIDKRYLTAK